MSEKEPISNFRLRGQEKKKGRFSMSEESANALLDLIIKIIGENTTGRFTRAALIGIASATVSIVSTEPPKVNVASVNQPAPPPPTPVAPSPPQVASTPPVPPVRDGIEVVNTSVPK